MKTSLLVLLALCAGSVCAQPADSLGNWQLLATEAAGPALIALDARDARTTMGIRCANNRTAAFIAWDTAVGGAPRIIYRIDDGEPVEQIWNAASDTAAAFVPERTVEFVRRVALHDSLSVTMTPPGGAPRTAVFDLAGMETALNPIREACGW